MANSDRFSSNKKNQYLSVIAAADDAKPAVIGTIAAGQFPRELRVTADGQSLLLTNFASGSSEVIDRSHLPMNMH